jgi:hypothetical protein
MALERIIYRRRPWSLKAIVAFVVVLLSAGAQCFPLIPALGVVFAFDALRDIKRMPDLNGKLLAFAAIGIGMIFTVGGCLLWLMFLLDKLGGK